MARTLQSGESGYNKHGVHLWSLCICTVWHTCHQGLHLSAASGASCHPKASC